MNYCNIAFVVIFVCFVLCLMLILNFFVLGKTFFAVMSYLCKQLENKE